MTRCNGVIVINKQFSTTQNELQDLLQVQIGKLDKWICKRIHLHVINTLVLFIQLLHLFLCECKHPQRSQHKTFVCPPSSSVCPSRAVEAACTHSCCKHETFAHVNKSVCFANPTRGRLLSEWITVCHPAPLGAYIGAGWG